jgi:FkbM family methyltransferase
LSEITVAAGVLKGTRLRLDLQVEKDYWLGTYETELQDAVREFIQPGWVVYDVGANIGYISLMLARAVGTEGQVFAFEALPANLERLRVNVALNELDARVQIIPGAVGASSAPVRFLVGPSGGMGKAEGSAGRQADYAQSIQVPGISLDDFVYQQGNPPPKMIKMDIEGGEILALPGMQRLLAEVHPVVFMELHGPEAAQASWQILTAAGYQISRMAPGFLKVPTLADLDWKAYIVAR